MLNIQQALRLSEASWDALLMFASSSCHEVGRGVNGFGDFPRKESHSAAWPNPGNLEQQIDKELRKDWDPIARARTLSEINDKDQVEIR